MCVSVFPSNRATLWLLVASFSTPELVFPAGGAVCKQNNRWYFEREPRGLCTATLIQAQVYMSVSVYMDVCARVPRPAGQDPCGKLTQAPGVSECVYVYVCM